MSYIALHALAFILVWLLFAAAGYLLELALPALTSVPRAVYLPALGICVWIAAMFVLASTQQLNQTSVGLLAVGVLVTASIVSLARTRANGFAPFACRVGWIDLIAWALPGAVLAAIFVAALRPEIGWDAGAYHLALPKIFIAHGGFKEVPLSVYSNWPQNVQLLFALAMLLQDHVLAKLLVVLFLMMLCVAVYSYSQRVESRSAGAIAAALLLANDVVLWGAELAYIDVAYALFLFLAFVMASDYLDTRHNAPLALAGVFCGFAAGTKMNGVFALTAIACLAGTCSIDWRLGLARSLRTAVYAIVVLSVLATALVVPWLVKSYLYTGNPVYPLFYDVFGGQYWSSRLGEQFLIWQRNIGMGRELQDYLLLPARIFLNAGDDYRHFAGRLNVVWIAVLPLTLVWFRHVAVRRCMVTAGAFFCLWAATTQEIRYLIPLLPLLCCAAGIALTRAARQAQRALTALPTGWTSPRWSLVVVPAVVAAIQIDALWMARHTFRHGQALMLTALRAPGVNLASPATDGVQFINSQLPAHARVMLLNTNQGFFLNRAYVADSFFEASQLSELFWTDPTVWGAAEVFRTLGVTHVLVYVPNRFDVTYPRALWQLLNDRRRVNLLYSSPDGEYSVLEIRN